ncbi:Uncharacterized protein AB751O23_AB_00240 [Chlamydiales bacterium SCGC AB-751-O23]|jgi:Kdo2-lipid IVA lauroyltransferase/acyltransferase|nr:Uncharacterized protein AB751O23_AB_00240 [Chlamydiales bacterium SCGC AB-751-O23]
MNKQASFSDYIKYALVRSFGFIISLLSIKIIHSIAKGLSPLFYYFYKPGVKQVMSNLSLATKMKLSLKQKKILCKQSFENLIIILLEYFKLSQFKSNIEKIIVCENPKKLDDLIKTYGSVVFACGHQSNWELPFLYITKRYPTIAVGTPVNNPLLYKWILSIRQMFKGEVIVPKGAVKKCVQALSQGKSAALVFDQAYPDSTYSYPLLGCRAWTTLGPAVISYRSKKPLIMISTQRRHNRYYCKFHDPIFPDFDLDIKIACPKSMQQLMQALEFDIMKSPHEWLWVHNRWKQVGVNFIPRRFRHSKVLVILPEDMKEFYLSLKILKVLQEIYSKSFISVFVPKARTEAQHNFPSSIEVKIYSYTKDILIEDWATQIVFDLSNKENIKRHYLKRSAFEVLNLNDLDCLASQRLGYKKDLEAQKKVTLALSRK